MRTTIAIDDDVLLQVKSYARTRSVSLGKGASELIRRGLQAERPTRQQGGLMIFHLAEDSPKVTTAHVRLLEGEEQ
jgi:hypothetical protein